MRLILSIILTFFVLKSIGQRSVVAAYPSGHIMNMFDTPYATRTPFPIVVLSASQSNMEGDNSETNFADNKYLAAINKAIVYFKNDSSSTVGSLTGLLYGTNNNWRSAQLTSTGPEISLGYDYVASTSKKFGLIKYALGGSTLVDDGSTTVSAGLWQIDGNVTRSGTWGLLYPKMINNFVINGIAKFVAAGFRPYIAALIICQGEADANVSYCASHWEAEEERLIDAFKTAIDPYADTDSMHVIISRTHNNFAVGTRPYLSTVRTAQVNVATHYGYYGHWINTDSYPVRTSDSTHWTKPGQTTHGLDQSTILKTIIR